MQRLAHIDVPEAGNDALVGERCLERCLFSPARHGQSRAVEFPRQRFRAEGANPAATGQAPGRDDVHQAGLRAAGHGEITTEIREAPAFYYAEDYHQQYLGKNPHGYCGLAGTGVSCPIGVGAK